MIYRETDPERINRVSNLPGVREFVCYHGGAMDWAAAFPSLDTGVIILTDGGDACGVFAMTDHRAFQVHTVFGPECRGKRAIAAARGMLEWISPHADYVWGATPIANAKARWFNRQLGAEAVGRAVYEVEGPVEIYRVQLSSASGNRLPELEGTLA